MTGSLPPGWDDNSSPREPAPLLTYAGFWLRTGAAIIDSVVLSVAGFVFHILALPSVVVDTIQVPGDQPSYEVAYRAQEFLYSLPFPSMHLDTTGNSEIFPLVCLIYSIVLEASPMQGTIGKMALGMKVCTERGERISLVRSLVRSLVKTFISMPFLMIGVLMVAFTPRKQGLHDLLARTLVVRPQTVVQFPGLR